MMIRIPADRQVSSLINRRWGKVLAIRSQQGDIQEIIVAIGEKEAKAYVHSLLTGPVRAGDKVLLNTTAVDLGLGSGGYHYVLANLTEDPEEIPQRIEEKGHIIKLRYTPLQFRVWAVEERSHPGHERIIAADGLAGVPVIAGSLHSMLIPCICGLKALGANLRAAYVMTDGGALPISFSKAVRALQDRGLICGTITAGHAFGGDLEAVNIYSALLAAREVLGAQIIVVLMGPGVVGTGTPWGTSALEVGQVINATASLGGISYTIPRLSFAEERFRHYGVSHHTITVLERVALAPTCLVLPQLESEQKKTVLNQLMGSKMAQHRLIWGQGQAGISLARDIGLEMHSMGKYFADDPAYFLAPSAAGEEAARQVMQLNDI